MAQLPAVPPERAAQARLVRQGFVALLATLVLGVAWAMRLPPIDPQRMGIKGPEVVFAVVFFSLSALAMWASHIWDPGYNTQSGKKRDTWVKKHIGKHQHLVGEKLRSVRGLFVRDFGPLSFDVDSPMGVADVREYRGLLHWHRDALEKFLSLFLTVTFSFLLGKAVLYLIYYLRGDPGLVGALEVDVRLAALLTGMALIVDGVLLVAGMTDAPGIGRTLDSLIVILAGVIVVELKPTLENPATQGRDSAGLLAVVVAGLFLVRWAVRHRTVNEWFGRRESRAGEPHDNP